MIKRKIVRIYAISQTAQALRYFRVRVLISIITEKYNKKNVNKNTVIKIYNKNQCVRN